MAIQRPKLNPQEAKILKALLEHDYFLTTTQVAKVAKVAWSTAQNHLNDFHKRGWIDKKQIGNRCYWRAYR